VPDKIILEFTREEAFQLLTVFTRLGTIARVHAPEMAQTPDMVAEKLMTLQAFVEGNT